MSTFGCKITQKKMLMSTNILRKTLNQITIQRFFSFFWKGENIFRCKMWFDNFKTYLNLHNVKILGAASVDHETRPDFLQH